MGRPIPEWQPRRSVEGAVLSASARSVRRHMEARASESGGEWSEERGRAALQASLALYHEHGQLISGLAVEHDLRIAIGKRMADVIARVPAWMEAHVYGVEIMSSRLFAVGCAQLMAEHRAAIEEIVEAEVDDPEPIEALLAEAPVPARPNEETTEALYESIGTVFGAHLRAMVAIARDIDEWVEEELEAGEDEE